MTENDNLGFDAMPVLEVRELSIQYPNQLRAVHNVSFTLNKGDCLAIVGESGSGKSTIAKAILGLTPSGTQIDGRILFRGSDINQLSTRELKDLRGKSIGFVGQDPYASCNPVYRVKNNVTEAWSAHGLKVQSQEIAKRLSALGIRNAAVQADLYPHQWSGGMLQRAEIAAASAHRPHLIIADEPTSALDSNLASFMLDLIASLGSTVLMISHDLVLVSQSAQQIAVCYAGRMVECGAARTVTSEPRHPYTQALLEAIPNPACEFPPSLPGTIPDLRKPVVGCVFHNRCPHAWEACRKKSPDFTNGVACHLNNGQGSLQWKRGISIRKSTQGNTSEAPVAELINVTRYFRHRGKKKPVFENISLRMYPGEIVGICGPSGVGKSTLLKVVAGIEPPNSGQISYDRKPVWRCGTLTTKRVYPRNGFSMSVFQNPYTSIDRRWPIWKTITEPMRAPHRNSNLNRIDYQAVAKDLLKTVGLNHLKGTEKPAELSIGQCQRISILRALTANPALIVADEPTSALDVTTAAGIYRLLRARADQGTSIIIVSHDETALQSLCDRLYRLNNGKLNVFGTIRTIKNRCEATQPENPRSKI